MAMRSWENYMPLLRYYEYTQGAQIHIASFLPAFEHPHVVLAQGHTDAIQALSKPVAVEGQMSVLQPTMIITEPNREKAGLGKLKVELISICLCDPLCYARLTCRFSLGAATPRSWGRTGCLWQRNRYMAVKEALCMRILTLMISLVQNSSLTSWAIIRGRIC